DVELVVGVRRRLAETGIHVARDLHARAEIQLDLGPSERFDAGSGRHDEEGGPLALHRLLLACARARTPIPRRILSIHRGGCQFGAASRPPAGQTVATPDRRRETRDSTGSRRRLRLWGRRARPRRRRRCPRTAPPPPLPRARDRAARAGFPKT